MSLIASFGIDGHTLLLLVVSLGIALSFEFVNGFHDTANAVATVIYTKSMRARHAVVLSGILNFVGVHIGGIGVAYAIVHLLPVDLLVEVNTDLGLAMVFALLLSAIVWNFGTWFLGLPASSSHTLIGSILGVGLANAFREGLPLASGVNWAKAAEVGMSLFISPVLGFVAAGGLLIAMKHWFKKSEFLHKPPQGDTPPPWGIRSTLIISGMGVSLAHGSNDGQKGVGLIMLILIGILPGAYALNLDASGEDIGKTLRAAGQLTEFFNAHRLDIDKAVAGGEIVMPAERELNYPIDCGLTHAIKAAEDIQVKLGGLTSLGALPEAARFDLRSEILCLDDAARRVSLIEKLDTEKFLLIESLRHDLRGPTEYAPDWVLMAVATALGLGTMIGWKRIVVTIGEKIGKTRLTYAQGAAAQIVAMTTIGLADVAGLPVSTTHVLSSGVAGTMAAHKSGLQGSTLRSIAMAWVLTLPAAMALGGGLFLLFSVLVK